MRPDDNRYKRTTGDLGINRFRLTPDEEQLLKSYRDEKMVLLEECTEAGINLEDVKHWWYKSKRISAFVKPQGKTIEELKETLIKDLNKYSPKFKLIKRAKFKDSYCLVIDLCDLHIGKLAMQYSTGNEYNTKIALERARNGVQELLKYSIGFAIDKIVLIIGNDILHTDNGKTTTKGTPQDTDGMWYSNFLLARDLYIQTIETLLPVADIHIIHDVSNHDKLSGWYLSQIIETYFRNSKNITFDTSLRTRKAFVYHQNLIGSTHNDGAKQSDLPSLLSYEFKVEWGQTTHRYIHTHHVHHKMAKDHIGVTIEASRSLSGTDEWHEKNGYVGVPKALEGFLYHKTKGQVARFSSIAE